MIKIISLILFLPCLSWGAARGSGASTVYSIGDGNDTLYLPVAREDPGWGTDSTDSINNNFIILSSAIYNLENLGGNTNYILLQSSLQSGATFYVSSGTVDQRFFINSSGTAAADHAFRVGQSSMLVVQGNGNVGIGTNAPGALFQVGAATFVVAGPTGRVGISTTAPEALFHVGASQGNTGVIVAISTGSTRLFEITGASITARAPTIAMPSLVSCDTINTNSVGELICGSDGGSSVPLPEGSTNYIQNTNSLQAGSTFYVASGTVGGNLTVTGHFASSGAVTLGDASSDLLTIQSSSVTLLNQTTFHFNNPLSRIISSSPTVCNQTILMPDGNFDLIRASNPTVTESFMGFETQSITRLDNTSAKAAWIQVECSYTGDAVATTQDLTLYVSGVGSGVANATRNKTFCRIVAANERATNANTVLIQLDSNKDFDFSCQTGSIETTQTCTMRLAGWCE